jgi:hypothetical protein
VKENNNKPTKKDTPKNLPLDQEIKIEEEKEIPVKNLKTKKEDINIKNDDDLPDWLKS